MKRLFAHMFNSLPKRVAAAVLAGVLVAVPVAAIAANQVTISATTGVGNMTAGDTQYSSSTNATYGQVVKVQVSYDNTEAPGSNLVANNVNVKINIPETPGATQNITTTTGGSNTNVVNGAVTVNVSDPTSFLEYIPGSAVAKVTATNGTISEFGISDDVVLGNGYNINNGNPCQSASVTVMARVMVPGIKIVKQSEILGQSNQWSNDNTAAPGDTMDYMITYQNIGNTEENDVAIGDNLPPGMNLVNGTTKIYTTTYPNGVLDTSNNIANGGINIGNFGPGSGAYVTFQATLPTTSQMGCGLNEYRNIGVAQAQGMDQYYNTAITDVTNNCTPPTSPTYSCDTLNVQTTGDREIEASTQTTATNGATLTSVTYNFGDGSTPLVTNEPSVNYTYANYGTYTVTATATFSVNGNVETSTNASCTKTVTFASPTTPPTVTTTTPATPTQLVNTGPGDVIGIFAGVTIAGAVGHRLFKTSRFARR